MIIIMSFLHRTRSCLLTASEVHDKFICCCCVCKHLQECIIARLWFRWSMIIIILWLQNSVFNIYWRYLGTWRTSLWQGCLLKVRYTHPHRCFRRNILWWVFMWSINQVTVSLGVEAFNALLRAKLEKTEA